VSAGWWWLLAPAGVALAVFLAAARTGNRADDTATRQAAQQRGRDIAYRIRAELVCCDIYDRVNSGEMTLSDVKATRDWHDLCYWGEASAQVAEGRCPGYETVPNICQCDCAGCRHSCDAHHNEGDPS
jgi:hypothetical protein